jgi:MFS family permease
MPVKMKILNQPGKGPTSASLILSIMCLAEVLTMLGTFAFPALLPEFIALWKLSNSQAGWISGIYYAGYTVAVPLLTSFTDRIDSRKIYLFACFIGVIANIGFAMFSSGFWSALIFRALCGISLAGTFIPGLKALIDRVDEKYIQRSVSFYTACFGLGMSLSFFYAGVLNRFWGWKSVFFTAAVCSICVLVVSAFVLAPKPVPRSCTTFLGLLNALDFRPVWSNARARTYILAYMCHMWEMFAARSWMVAFLTFSLLQNNQATGFIMPTTVMAVAGVLGMAASILFGELAVRFGRRKLVSVVMTISGLLGLSIGFMGEFSYPLMVFLCIIYTIFFQGDSASIHAGVITAADPERQGATMALQSLGGFAAASCSPIIAGVILDITGGGETVFSWGCTFLVMGIVSFIGVFMVFTRQRPIPKECKAADSN